MSPRTPALAAPAGLAAAFAGVLAACATPLPSTVLELVREPQESGTDVLLQAVSPVDEHVVWVSGHGGTYARTVDGGRTWRANVVPGADTLQFRDVEGFDERTALLMSAGTGELSRIYGTHDAGATWTLRFVVEEPDGFLDCMAFWNRAVGVAYGDAVGGELYILRTEDGGATWTRLPPSALPRAQEGEGGFAASGACVATHPDGRGWIATGNAERARVLSSEDFGRTWTATPVPVVSGAMAGLTAVDFVGDRAGFAVGGRIGADTARTRNVVVTTDGGSTWRIGGELRMPGPAYGGAYVPGLPAPVDSVLFAVGPGGADWSPDMGRSWQTADTATYWAVAFAGPRAGWATGPGGRITRFGFVAR